MKRSIILRMIAVLISVTVTLIGYIVRDTTAQVSSGAFATLPPQQEQYLTFKPIYFGYNQVAISPSSAKALDHYGRMLKADPTITVMIAGHTDSREPAKDELSKKRALSVNPNVAKKLAGRDRF
jgi:outer membrane protein OmpA-like peptidoglycan-associated protein